MRDERNRMPPTSDKRPVPRAPYSFVPFPETVVTIQGELPRHDEIDPERLSGEVHITLRAESPVLISGFRDDEARHDKSKRKQRDCHFYRDANGRFLIPGSSLRGLLRNNCQILSFGIVRADEDFDDYILSFRGVAGNDKILRDYYRTVLKLDDKDADKAELVQPGYLSTKDGKHFALTPVSWDKVKLISRDDKHLADIKRIQKTDYKTQKPLTDWDGNPIYRYADKNGQINEQILPLDTRGERWHVVSQQNDRAPRLLCTGRFVGKENPHYLFPAPALCLNKSIDVPDDDILAFRKDLEARSTTLKNKDFWMLPKKQETKPVFYLRHGEHIYLGMSRFLRVEYPHKLSTGLPKEHRKLGGTSTLDHPHAMFGFIQKGGYRSRIWVGDCLALGRPQELQPETVVLAGPKPTWYYGYLRPEGRYLDDDFRLRGYKQYWLKDVDYQKTGNDNKKVNTILHPLPAGTEFAGVIRFKNLSEQELGLLLWAIRLEDGCFQSIGMGKPFGLGRMSMRIDELRLLDRERAYTELTASPWNVCTDKVADYIDGYDRSLLAGYGGTECVSERSEIKDFFYLRSTIPKKQNVSYMTLDEYQKNRRWLPTVAQVREEGKE